MTSRTVHPGDATIGGGVRAHHGSMVRRVPQERYCCGPARVIAWVTCQGITSVAGERLWIVGLGVAAGGERWVAHTFGAGDRGGGVITDLLSGDCAVGRRRAAVVQLRPAQDPSADSSARNPASSRSHCCQSWSRRTRSASRIASASSSTAAGVSCVSVVMSLTSFPDHRGRGPGRVRR
jgi:hypothetical protein